MPEMVPPNLSPKILELENRFKSNPDSKIFAQLAEEYRKAGLFEKSIDVCKLGLKKHPNYISALVTLGHAYMGTEKWDAARSELEKAVQMSSENILANKLLGVLYKKEGSYQQALEKLKIVQMLNPGDSEVLHVIHEIEELARSQSSKQEIPAKDVIPPSKEKIQEKLASPFPAADLGDGIMDLKIDESIILNAQQMDQIRSGAGVGEEPAQKEVPKDKPDFEDHGADVPTAKSAVDEIFGDVSDVGAGDLSDFSAPTIMMSSDDMLAKYGIPREESRPAGEGEDVREVRIEEPVASAAGDNQLGLEMDSLSDFAAPTLMMSAEELQRLAAEKPAPEAEKKDKVEEKLKDQESIPDILESEFTEGSSFLEDQEAHSDERLGDEELFETSEASHEALFEGKAAEPLQSDDDLFKSLGESFPEVPLGVEALEGEEIQAGDSEKVDSWGLDEAPKAVAAKDDFSTGFDLEQIIKEEETGEMEGGPIEGKAEPLQEPVASKTLAELYLQQGHLDKALEVYQALHREDPFDEEIGQKIKELSGETAGEEKFKPVEVPEMPVPQAGTLEEKIQEMDEGIKTRSDAVPVATREEKGAEKPVLMRPTPASPPDEDLKDLKKKKADKLQNWLSSFKKQKSR